MYIAGRAIETVYRPEVRTVSIVTLQNGIRIFKCHDRMFDNIVLRAQKTELLL